MEIKSLLILTNDEMDDLLDLSNTIDVKMTGVDENPQLVSPQNLYSIMTYLIDKEIFDEVEDIVDCLCNKNHNLIFTNLKENKIKKGIFIPLKIIDI
jgi:hypothetical protein